MRRERAEKKKRGSKDSKQEKTSRSSVHSIRIADGSDPSVLERRHYDDAEEVINDTVSQLAAVFKEGENAERLRQRRQQVCRRIEESFGNTGVGGSPSKSTVKINMMRTTHGGDKGRDAKTDPTEIKNLPIEPVRPRSKRTNFAREWER